MRKTTKPFKVKSRKKKRKKPEKAKQIESK